MRTKYLILAGLLLLTAVIIRGVGYDLHTPATDGLAVIKKVPYRLEGWQGTDVSLPESVFELLETRAIIHREYAHLQNPAEVFLSIVYYNKTKVDFHAPESCLGGLGIKTEREPGQVKIDTRDGVVDMELYQLIQTVGGNQTLVYYFYKTGRFIGRNYLNMRLNLVFNKFTGNQPSGSLIRISTPIMGTGGAQAARSRLQAFLQDLYPVIISEL